jgi:hypothetical protein
MPFDQVAYLHYTGGVVVVALDPRMPTGVRRLALSSKPQIEGLLGRVCQEDRSALEKLRSLVTAQTSRNFPRKEHLIAYLADVAASPQHPILVADLHESLYHFSSRQQEPAVAQAAPGGEAPQDVRSMSITQRVERVVTLTADPKLIGHEAAEQLKGLVSGPNLAIMAGSIAVLIGAHAFGVGEAADVILLAVGFIMLGPMIIDVVKLLVKMFGLIKNAQTDDDLKAAAEILAKVITLIGIMALISLLTKGAAKRARLKQQRIKSEPLEAPKVEPKAGKVEPKAEPPKPVPKSKIPADIQGKLEKVSPADRAKLEPMYEKAPAAKAEIDTKAHAVADQFEGGRVAEAPLKSPARVLEKANGDYGGDVTRVKDYARNTVVVQEGDKGAALGALKEQYPGLPDKNITVVDAAKDPCGYSGIKVNVPTKDGMIAETQINSPEMIFAKEKPADARAILGDKVYDGLASKPGMPEGGLGHAYYEQYRVLDPGTAEAQQVASQSRAYYDAVRGAAGGGG